MTITIENCLQGFNSDNPCGENLESDSAFIALRAAIKGKPETQFSEAIPPNWREINKAAQELLARSIDLEVLVSYLRALIASQGFSGLAEGLALIQALVAQRWDSIYPQLDPDDDNDPTERINILTALCDSETILRPLSQIPLLESKLVGKFSFREVSVAVGKSAATANEKVIAQSTIDGAVQDCEADSLTRTLIALSGSLETLDELEKFVTEQVGVSNAPSFAELRTFLKEAKWFLVDWTGRRGLGQENPVEAKAIVEAETGVASTNSGASEGKSISGAINNNQDVIKALTLICDYYKKHEPSSPVPMFLQRGMNLIGKSFMEVLEDVAPMGVEQAMVFKGKQDDAQ